MIGTVEFFDGITQIGGPLPIAGDGPASIQVPLEPGTYTFTAVFTPDDPTAFSGSTSPAVTYVVEPAP